MSMDLDRLVWMVPANTLGWVDHCVSHARAKIMEEGLTGRFMVKRRCEDETWISFFTDLEEGLDEYSLQLIAAADDEKVRPKQVFDSTEIVINPSGPLGPIKFETFTD